MNGVYFLLQVDRVDEMIDREGKRRQSCHTRYSTVLHFSFHRNKRRTTKLENIGYKFVRVRFE